MRRAAIGVALVAAVLGAGVWHALDINHDGLADNERRGAHNESAAPPPAPQTPLARIDDPEAWALAITQHDTAADVEPVPAAAVAEPLVQFAADARSDDADRRAAAIDALSRSPKSQAVPILRALLSATGEEDRQRVLGALHTLAVEQGDDDGAIGEVLRLTIYDGDDAGIADSARTILDGIEQELVQSEVRQRAPDS